MEGGTADARRRHGPHAREPHQRDRRRRRRQGLRRGHRDHRGDRLPDVRLLLGHVHRQLDELPDRGARPRAARQRLGRSPRTPRARRCTRRPATPSSTSRAATTTTTTSPCCPRAIATREAFENAMALDIAMGGSTNTILHLLAAAQEAELDFTMQDIDEVSRRVPCLSKVAPNGTYLMEDVPPRRRHPRDPRRAAPRRAAQRGRQHRPHRLASSEWLADWDIRGGSATDEAIELFHAAPGCVRSATAFSPVRALGDAGHRRGRAAASATSSTRTPRTAASRSCTATSPSTAAS